MLDNMVVDFVLHCSFSFVTRERPRYTATLLASSR